MSHEDSLALALHEIERIAMYIVTSEFEGGKFNYRTMSWVRPE